MAWRRKISRISTLVAKDLQSNARNVPRVQNDKRISMILAVIMHAPRDAKVE
jgi:hypothetical protein